jgi:hypothetical protein
MQAAGVDEDNTVKSSRIDWWWNNTNINHLRLSFKGINFVNKQTKIPIYTIDIAHPLLSTHFIQLTRINIGPYYIHSTSTHNKIMLLKNESATMLTLHAGNLGQYLKNLEE